MSCVNLAQISYIDMGKVAEIESKCVLELCKLLTDPIQAVREEASQALASLAQKNEAKHQVLFFRIIILSIKKEFSLFFKRSEVKNKN